MRATIVSDTHGLHSRIAVGPTDLLIHCGDFSVKGRKGELARLLAWMAEQSAMHRVLVLGNHDRYAREHPDETRVLAAQAGVHWLEDSGVTIAGLSLWGSSCMPPFRARGEVPSSNVERRARWERMPKDLDILITHVPPLGIADAAHDGTPLGCPDLRDIVGERAPRLHVFGHVHEAHGEARVDGLRTRFVNAASLPLRSKHPRAPLELTLNACG